MEEGRGGAMESIWGWKREEKGRKGRKGEEGGKARNEKAKLTNPP